MARCFCQLNCGYLAYLVNKKIFIFYQMYRLEGCICQPKTGPVEIKKLIALC